MNPVMATAAAPAPIRGARLSTTRGTSRFAVIPCCVASTVRTFTGVPRAAPERKARIGSAATALLAQVRSSDVIPGSASMSGSGFHPRRMAARSARDPAIPPATAATVAAAARVGLKRATRPTATSGTTKKAVASANAHPNGMPIDQAAPATLPFSCRCTAPRSSHSRGRTGQSFPCPPRRSQVSAGGSPTFRWVRTSAGT
jgi:hypothetical protein